jgi:hypothetical protein
MNWGRLNEAKWWWEYALDGVVGGIIGGLVTGLAVWLTLRHERKLVAEAVERDRLERDQTSVREQAIELQSAIWRLVEAPTGEADNLAKVREAQFTLMALATGRWHGFATTVVKSCRAVAAATERARAGEKDHALGKRCAETVAVLAEWIRDPAHFEEPVTTPPEGGLRRMLRAPHWARVRRRDS